MRAGKYTKVTVDNNGTITDVGFINNADIAAVFDSTPTGSVVSFAGSASPTGWLLCDGSAVSRTTYSTLFSVMSTTYGIGDGSTTFNLPNLKGRVPVGLDSSQTEFDVLGETGGLKAVTLTGAQSGTSVHGHGNNIGTNNDTHGHSTNTAGDASNFLSGSTVNMRYSDSTNPTLNTSNDTHNHTMSGGVLNSVAANAAEAHTNLQPYIVLNYIIKT
jgi:microcystin-dependent protein